mmetsp:Transcript_16241/g.39998  ORF Transcript_16241/g.39998 Transcript_16241/m.39998 type:complete len:189 (+) Transcript_16241:3-569(+)|eukprot:CAMPEP_0198312364 /NCGR_PEP_ID=MMETSP1450-20131203/3751_1 /TAXON_ID=753684 ORGANISM="Madagascaria erythrocladiodes, Strain CCMP3234" /NCGR_SAMPLE_ID=MMETSP1450 /ASSEMBLY_ACC=CAM_ASM_001115 /LENGTH=188 /DNA_ID=CAMNT_0044015309 /DNA_START=81 /DNA_END=647 /DNA_ORIENTATION=-
MAEEPPTKKAKSDEFPPLSLPDHKMNLAKMLVKDSEGKSLHELVDSPISVLQGISERADVMMEALRVNTIKELAAWKYGVMAQAIAVCASLEEDGKRMADSVLNLDNALDKEHESKSLAEIVALPPSALQGLPPKADEELQSHHITTIQKLADWKYMKWAQAVTALVDYEETKSAEQRKAEKMLKKLE